MPSTATALPSYRSTDAIITICQDNTRKRIDVRGLNPAAETMLGLVSNKIEGHDLVDLLPQRIRGLLKEYVEFEDDGNDVGTVLGKVQSFCILDNAGKEVAVRLKVLRSESLDKNAYFKLILQGQVASAKKDEAFRAVLRENFRGHEVLETNTGLPDRHSLTRDIGLVLHYINKDMLSASFAAVRLDQADDIRAKHGPEIRYAVLKHIAAIARQNLRPDDVIGCLKETSVGIILMDTTPESARMVLNRLRWLIAAHAFELPNQELLPVTVSISFAAVKPHSIDKELVLNVETHLQHGLASSNGNLLVEYS